MMHDFFLITKNFGYIDTGGIGKIFTVAIVTTVLIGYCDYLGTRPKNSRRLIIVTGRYF